MNDEALLTIAREEQRILSRVVPGNTNWGMMLTTIVEREGKVLRSAVVGIELHDPALKEKALRTTGLNIGRMAAASGDPLVGFTITGEAYMTRITPDLVSERQDTLYVAVYRIDPPACCMTWTPVTYDEEHRISLGEWDEPFVDQGIMGAIPEAFLKGYEGDVA